MTIIADVVAVVVVVVVVMVRAILIVISGMESGELNWKGEMNTFGQKQVQDDDNKPNKDLLKCSCIFKYVFFVNNKN